MKRRAFNQLAPAGVMALLMGNPVVQRAVAQQAGGDTLTLALPNDVVTWDPNARVRPNQIELLKAVFAQPLEYDKDSKLQPSLISKWEWLDDTGTTLGLHFRDDVLFHNGDRFTAEDFRFSFFERPRSEPDVQLRFIWNTLDDIEIVSPTQAVMRFNSPMVTAPEFLGFTGAFVVPKAYFQKVGLDEFVRKPVGAGPYRLVEYQRDSRLVFEAFEDYFGGAAQIKRVVVLIVKDPTARVSALEAGQVNLATNLPLREAERLGRNPRLRTAITPTIDNYLISLVNREPFSDKNLRLAMHHAIDKKALTKAFFNDIPQATYTLAPPGTPAYDPDFVFPYDPAKAIEYLAASGFGPDKPIAIKFFTTRGVNPNDFEMARAITQMWSKVGIAADLQVIDPPVYQAKAAAGELEGCMLWLGGNATGDPELTSGYALNPRKPFAVWRSEDCAEKLDPLFKEADYDKRIEGYKAFNIWAVQQGYSLPLMQGVVSIVHTASPPGYTPYASGWVLPYQWRPNQA
ncbi:ABC transporter substrate-binding protein [Lampropedia cohaerens]|uniref:ABC transporter substrate-binding protein n=1 Tax=Lampropedia cohaerens TaxID=1610491 RepID=UPI000A07D3D0|nr:ABC transporter substrate-binding protein [Lampropedia cohaerens]